MKIVDSPDAGVILRFRRSRSWCVVAKAPDARSWASWACLKLPRDSSRLKSARLVHNTVSTLPVVEAERDDLSCFQGISQRSIAGIVLLLAFVHYWRLFTTGVRLLPAFDYYRCSITTGVGLLPAFVHYRRSFIVGNRLHICLVVIS